MPDLFDKIRSSIKFNKAGKGQVLGSSNQTNNVNTRPSVPSQQNQQSKSSQTSQTKVGGGDDEPNVVFLKCPCCNGKVVDNNYTVHSFECFENFHPTNENGVDLLFRAFYTYNQKSGVLDAISLIKRYLTNIINDPTNERFHRIKLSNKQFKEKVLVMSLAIPLFRVFGFRLQTQTTGSPSQQPIMADPHKLDASPIHKNESNQVNENNHESNKLNDENIEKLKICAPVETKNDGANSPKTASLNLIDEDDRVLVFSTSPDDKCVGSLLKGRLDHLFRNYETRAMLKPPQLYSRNIKVLKVDMKEKNNNVIESVEDADFELDRTDIIRQYKELKEKTNLETSFTSSKQREQMSTANKLFTLTNFKISTIKIKLTDILTVQAEFLPTESVVKLYDFLSHYIVKSERVDKNVENSERVDKNIETNFSNNCNLNHYGFRLMIKDPKQRTIPVNTTTTLHQENLFPSAILYLHSLKDPLNFKFD